MGSRIMQVYSEDVLQPPLQFLPPGTIHIPILLERILQPIIQPTAPPIREAEREDLERSHSRPDQPPPQFVVEYRTPVG